MAKAVFLSGYVNFGGTTIYVTSIDVNEVRKVIDTTDLSTTLDEFDLEASSRRTTITLEGWKDLAVGFPARDVVHSTTVNMEGYQWTGNAVIHNITMNAVFDTAIKLVITATFTGSITEVNLGS